MLPEHEALLIFTREQFPELNATPCEVEVILKGASDRHFYRLKWQAEREPMILMVYTLARRDNPKFVPATYRLQKIGAHVPQVYAFDEQRLCVWLEDLGRIDLQSFNDHPWERRLPLYQATLREAAKFHGVGENTLTAVDINELEPGFDEALYEWEQGYFLEHYVRGYLGRDVSNAERGELLKQPQAIRHRHPYTLPKIPVDFVSYSAYDCQMLPAEEVRATLDYVNAQLPPGAPP